MPEKTRARSTSRSQALRRAIERTESRLADLRQQLAETGAVDCSRCRLLAPHDGLDDCVGCSRRNLCDRCLLSHRCVRPCSPPADRTVRNDVPITGFCRTFNARG
jgi:hypothetical protein